MARIEAQAYQLLAQLGASQVTSVLTAGGGAVNDKWTAMRAAALGVPVQPAQQGESSAAMVWVPVEVGTREDLRQKCMACTVCCMGRGRG
jgi:sugar (pentulose or hexulose) kinase